MARVLILRGSRTPTFNGQRLINFSRRRLSTTPPHGPDPNSKKVHARLTQISARLPKFLQRYTTPLINAPATHIVSFFVLHEVTAVVPLLALLATFHFSSWTPGFITQGKWFNNGMQKSGNYLRKKGWLGQERKTRRYKWWNKSEVGVRIMTE